MNIFWKKVKRERAEELNLTLGNCWVSGYNVDLTITTVIYATTYQNRFTGDKKVKYDYVQYVPLIKNPFYDGDMSTNRLLNAKAVVEKARAQKWIDQQI